MFKPEGYLAVIIREGWLTRVPNRLAAVWYGEMLTTLANLLPILGNLANSFAAPVGRPYLLPHLEVSEQLLISQEHAFRLYCVLR
jgi:hypothetical protein